MDFMLLYILNKETYIMRILPILPNIYSSNIKTSQKTNSIKFCGTQAAVVGVTSNAIKEVNINNIMQVSADLINKFHEALKMEPMLRSKADSIFETLTERISTILKDNGFNPEILSPGNPNKGTMKSEVSRFFELMERQGGDTIIESTPVYNFDRWAIAQLSDHPEDVLTQTEYRLTLKSKKYKDSILEIYLFPKRTISDCVTNDYIFGVESYQDGDYHLQSDKRDHYYNRSNILNLRNNPDIETRCSFKEDKFHLYSKAFPISDKINNITYDYKYGGYAVESITLKNENAYIDLYAKTITQNFTDKKVIHHLSDDLRKTLSIEFSFPPKS